LVHWIGAHTVDSGGMDMAMRRAANAGMNTMQLFTAIPKFYGDKSNMSEDRVRRFRAAVKETGMDPARFVTHGAYVLNTGTPDADKWTRARDGLTKELERSSLLGIGIVCYHPGAATDGDRVGAAERIAGAIVYALEKVPSKTRILVENTAGAGSTMARTAEEVGMILANIPKKHRARTGYGLDTCHLYASGYDIAKSKDEFCRTLDAFESEAGEAPGFFHINDSDGALGSNRDRHALIGKGLIGVEPFRWLLADRRSRDVPLILEHNQQIMQPEPNDDAPDPYDLEMMELMRRISE